MSKMLFIFEYLGQVSGSGDYWNSAGGAIVVAFDRADAATEIDNHPELVVTEDEWAQAIEIQVPESVPNRVIVFPEAGCSYCT